MKTAPSLLANPTCTLMIRGSAEKTFSLTVLRMGIFSLMPMLDHSMSTGYRSGVGVLLSEIGSSLGDPLATTAAVAAASNTDRLERSSVYE